MGKNYNEKPKQKRAIETRKKLIRAAEELFDKKGFYDTTSKDIAKEAGVSIGIFYNYFKDKSKIYYECLNLGYDDDSSEIIELLKKLKKLFDEDGDLKTKIYNYLYDGLLKIKTKIKIVMERSRIMADYPEIKKLIEKRNEEVTKEVENYFSGEDAEIIAKLIVETTRRNAIFVLSIEDSKKQEKYMEYLAEMFSCFFEKFKK